MAKFKGQKFEPSLQSWAFGSFRDRVAQIYGHGWGKWTLRAHFGGLKNRSKLVNLTGRPTRPAGSSLSEGSTRPSQVGSGQNDPSGRLAMQGVERGILAKNDQKDRYGDLNRLFLAWLPGRAGSHFWPKRTKMGQRRL